MRRHAHWWYFLKFGEEFKMSKLSTKVEYLKNLYDRSCRWTFSSAWQRWSASFISISTEKGKLVAGWSAWDWTLYRTSRTVELLHDGHFTKVHQLRFTVYYSFSLLFHGCTLGIFIQLYMNCHWSLETDAIKLLQYSFERSTVMKA